MGYVETLHNTICGSNPPVMTFNILTNQLANVSIEKSADLNTWIPYQLLNYIPEMIKFETSEPGGFYRAVVIQPTE